METISDFLVICLEAIDERLLEYLDDDGELKLDVVTRQGGQLRCGPEGARSPALRPRRHCSSSRHQVSTNHRS